MGNRKKRISFIFFYCYTLYKADGMKLEKKIQIKIVSVIQDVYIVGVVYIWILIYIHIPDDIIEKKN